MSDVIMTKQRMQRQLSHVADLYRPVLHRIHDTMLENLIFDPVHDHLITRQAFDTVTLADIKEESKTSGQIRLLLFHLKRADVQTYYFFKEALHKTKQSYLCNILSELEKQVHRELKSEVTAMAPSSLQVPESPVTQPESSLFENGSFKNIRHKENDGGS